MRYKQKSMNRKVMDDREIISQWTMLVLCPAIRRQLLLHWAQDEKVMEQLLDPQELKTITRKQRPQAQ